MPFSKIVSNAQRQYSHYKVTGIIVSHDSTLPMDVFAANTDGKKINCQADPFTGQILGIKKESEVLKFLRDLHTNLLSGKTGRTLNGVGAACLFTLAIEVERTRRERRFFSTSPVEEF